MRDQHYFPCVHLSVSPLPVHLFATLSPPKSIERNSTKFATSLPFMVRMCEIIFPCVCPLPCIRCPSICPSLRNHRAEFKLATSLPLIVWVCEGNIIFSVRLYTFPIFIHLNVNSKFSGILNWANGTDLELTDRYSFVRFWPGSAVLATPFASVGAYQNCCSQLFGY